MEFMQLKSSSETIYSPAGSRIKEVHEMRMTKSGHKYISKVGEINIYERIQDHKDECDAKKIIQRAKLGDSNAIARIQNARTNYGDTTLIPHNLMEAQQMIIDGKKAFNSLPKEIREKFNNDPMQFLANEQKVAEVTEQYLKDNGYLKEEEPVKPVKTVTTEEVKNG